MSNVVDGESSAAEGLDAAAADGDTGTKKVGMISGCKGAMRGVSLPQSTAMDCSKVSPKILIRAGNIVQANVESFES